MSDRHLHIRPERCEFAGEPVLHERFGKKVGTNCFRPQQVIGISIYGPRTGVASVPRRPAPPSDRKALVASPD